MKSTGIIRKIDPLGRIVIPMELRRTMKLEEGTPMEIFVEGNQIITKKYNAQNACMITGEILDENIEYAPGLFLSPEGAKLLLQTLKDKY